MARLARETGRPQSLIEAIREVADCPCAKHQDAFLDALAGADELLFKAVDGPSLEGTDGDIHLAKVDAHGQTFLLAFPDLDAGHRHDPNATIVGIGREEALRMVLDDPSTDGMLIVAATDNDAWAVAPRDSIDNLLSR